MENKGKSVCCPNCYLIQPLVVSRTCHSCGRALPPTPAVLNAHLKPMTEVEARRHLGMMQQRLAEDGRLHAHDAGCFPKREAI